MGGFSFGSFISKSSPFIPHADPILLGESNESKAPVILFHSWFSRTEWVELQCSSLDLLVQISVSFPPTHASALQPTQYLQMFTLICESNA